MTDRVWLITGVSESSLGRGFAEAALAAGDFVAGTVLKQDEAQEFAALQPGRSFGHVLDVTDFAASKALVRKIETDLGQIDILVNSAGRGHEGTVEEASIEELRAQFNVNVLGPLALIQAVLPAMRSRGSGRIINITSMGGLITVPGLGLYHAAKFAMEGLSETLAKEVEGFGIHVTAVAPGSFQTGWAKRSVARTPRHIEAYESVFEPLRREREKRSVGRTGSPRKAGQALLKLVEDKNPPRHLLLGSDAIDLVTAKLDELGHEIDTWKSISRSTDDFELSPEASS